VTAAGIAVSAGLPGPVVGSGNEHEGVLMSRAAYLTAVDRYAGDDWPGSAVASAFADAVESGRLSLPLPGGGRTRERWAVLADLAGEDLSLARLAEGHADALAILAELGHAAPPAGSRWGVWAAQPPGRAWRARGRQRHLVVSRLRPNRIDRPGTGQEAWDPWPALRHLPAVDPLAWSSVVVVAAHPDDEVLGVGGTMAMLAAAEARLRLIALTDGEASHPGEDPEVIARTRVAESAAALGVLGATSAELIRLRLPDTGLAAREDELVGLLRGAFASQLTGRAAGAGPVLPAGVVAHFTRPREVLLR
jgi:GlcNAc-PI de-N-acetylase